MVRYGANSLGAAYSNSSGACSQTKGVSVIDWPLVFDGVGCEHLSSSMVWMARGCFTVKIPTVKNPLSLFLVETSLAVLIKDCPYRCRG